MNFYKRYMGDYSRKTGHLSLAEHGAYTLLLDTLYATEKGLPASFADLFRICRAMSKSEQQAVTKVAEEFFPVSPDGLRYNNRATEEIDSAAPAIQAAKENGKKGGRPKKETREKPSGFSEVTQGESSPEPEPDTSPSLRSGEGRATRLPDGWKLPDEYREFCVKTRPDLDPDAVAAGFVDHWASQPGKDGRKADWLATWRNWVRRERAPFKRQQPQPDGHWTDTRSGVEAKARELGLSPWDEINEQWPVFLGRVKRAAGEQPVDLGALEAMARQRMAA